MDHGRLVVVLLAGEFVGVEHVAEWDPLGLADLLGVEDEKGVVV